MRGAGDSLHLSALSSQLSAIACRLSASRKCPGAGGRNGGISPGWKRRFFADGALRAAFVRLQVYQKTVFVRMEADKHAQKQPQNGCFWAKKGLFWGVFRRLISGQGLSAFSFRCSVPGLDPSRFVASHPSRNKNAGRTGNPRIVVRRNPENQGWGTRRLRFVVSRPSQKARRMGHPVLWGCLIPENQG